MRGIQGALIVASALQIILGFSGLWAVVIRYLSPLSAVPLITLVALGLYELGFPGVGKCIEIGLPQLIALVFFSQYGRHIRTRKKPLFERFAIVIAVAIVWAYAHILTVGGAYKHAHQRTQAHCRTDRSRLVSGAKWISVPYPFQWGGPVFDGGQSFAMMAAAFVSLVESTGTFYAVSRFASATPPPPSIISRGIGWQGIGILLDGMFGTGNGSTVSVENAGLLGLTRVGSRRVLQISAGFMIFFSVLGDNQLKCSHYRRRCQIRAPSCNEVFDCRNCHNEAKNSMDVHPHDRHNVPRHEVRKVQQTCVTCGVCMGKYFCEKCNFFDDEDSKQQYHCDGCGICRTGGNDNFFHCYKRGCCHSIRLKDCHPCGKSNAPQLPCVF